MAMLSGRLTAILSKHLKPMQISLRAVDYLFVRIGCGQGKLIIGDQKRFYSIQAREGSKEEIVIQSTPYYYRFIPKFFIQKVGFKTRSYDELNSIDFHEKSDLDSYVPLTEYNTVFERAVKAEAQLNHERKKCDQILIPLSIRHFAFIIEDECSAVTFVVPPNIKATKDFSQNDIQRMYKFFNIFQQYKQQNMYVGCVSAALEESFKREWNIEEISGNYVHEYNQFMLNFCRSVVLAINFGNKLVAHSENSGVARESLSVFIRPVDKFMTIFYNALMGHPAKSDS